MLPLAVVCIAAFMAYGVTADDIGLGRTMDIGHAAGAGGVAVAAESLFSARALSGAAEFAIESARATEAVARGLHANAVHNVRTIEAARLANVHRANAAAVENTHATRAASAAAHAGADELARAAEAERVANVARLRAIAIANARAVEVNRLANVARAQAAAAAVSAARVQALADAMAHSAHASAVRESSIVVGPALVAASSSEGHTRSLGADAITLIGYDHGMH